jgi:hypothetical protein
MPICPHCGTALPNESKFCFKCGKPTQTGTPTEAPTWEIVRLIQVGREEGIVIKKQFTWWQAVKSTSQGEVLVAETEELDNSLIRAHRERVGREVPRTQEQGERGARQVAVAAPRGGVGTGGN